MTKYTTFHLF